MYKTLSFYRLGFGPRLALAIVLLISFGNAQDTLKPISQYVHNVWRTEEGLPQNSVQAILQTRDGYLWMGTEEGLVRFNGVQFTLFNKANTAAIRHNDVRSLMEDGDGNLWIGTFGGGVLQYRDGQFRAYTEKEGLSNNFVNSLLQDSKGNIWIATNNGLNQLKNGQFSRMGKDSGLLDDGFNSLAEDSNGNIWVGTNRGLNQVNHGIFDSANIKRILERNVIRALYVDHSGVLWIGTDQLGLYAFRSGDLVHFGSVQHLPKAPVLAMIQDEHSSLWVGMGGGGLCRLDNFHSPVKFECYTSRKGLSGDTVMSLFEDREKSIWVGTETGGANRFKDGSLITYGETDGLNGAVRSIYGARDGALWVALNTGLRRMKNGRVTSYPTPNGPANNYAWTVLEDRTGNIWVGTNGGGLNVFTKQGVKTYTTDNGLPDNQIHAVFQDHAGNIWIGTERGGISSLVHGRFRNYSTRDGLPDNRVWTIFEDHDQNLWFGTDGGLSRFDQGKFTTADLHDDQNGGLATGGVVHVYQDQDGVFWIGTYGSGLKRLAKGKLTTYTTRDGLFDDSVWAILEDDHGRFWMSSNLGIFQVEKSDLNAFADGKVSKIRSISYGMSDGMLGTECNGGAQNPAWKAPEGALLFACVRGIVAVTPGDLKSNPLPPPVAIETALVNGRDVLRQNRTDAIGRGDLEFHFAGLSYVAPEKVTFKYRLEGFDQDWIFAGSRRDAYYTNIPAGQYTFRVIASNNDGVWNGTGAAVIFYIRPHFYQTLAFYCVTGLGLILLCAALYWIRVGQLQRRERELMRVVDERTRDLQQEIDERIRVEEDLTATAAIVKSSHEAIWSSDLNRIIMTWNEGAEMLFGYSAREAIGKNISMLLLPDSATKVDHHRSLVEDGRRIQGFEGVLVARGGTPRYVSLTLSPVYRQGKVVAVSAIAHDIESRKQAEEALKRAKQAAEAATRAKSEFLANMSHEIRTPLNGVLGMIELVNGTSLTLEQKELLEMARSSADALVVIIDDVLDFSKIEAGKLQLSAEAFDLRDAMAEATGTVAVRAYQKRLELVYWIATDAPQKVIGDAHRLKQVLINLLGNAIKFTEVGEVVLRVQVERYQDQKVTLKFSVSDTGIGISSAQQQAIFAAFEQADASTTRRFGGTGLGLAISSRIVSMMGGALGVTSEPGKGSIFDFTAAFPVAEPARPQALTFSGVSALIVDDSEANRGVLKDMVEHWGMTVTTTASGTSAIEELHRAAAARAPFRLILLDYRMPERDGAAVAEWMWQHPELRVPTIMLLTSHDYQAALYRCKDFGIAAHLIKPVRPMELFTAIATVLERVLPDCPPELVPSQAEETHQENLSVLLVEDNMVNQRLACRLLQKAGHSVVLAANGKEALAQFEKQRFDVILMDVQMPDLDGLAATEIIRRKEAPAGLHCPIIAMTAHAMQGDKEICLAAGMDGYISKPINMQTLGRVIHSVLQKVNKQRRPAQQIYSNAT